MPSWTNEQFNEWQRRRSAGLGAMGRPERKPNPKSALEQDPQTQPSRQESVVYRVCIISVRTRLLDDDNSASGGNKALRDAIAAWLGIDDGDRRIRFTYGQVLAGETEGTIVKIERVIQSTKSV